jgi:hypothetical protein
MWWSDWLGPVTLLVICAIVVWLIMIGFTNKQR